MQLYAMRIPICNSICLTQGVPIGNTDKEYQQPNGNSNREYQQPVGNTNRPWITNRGLYLLFSIFVFYWYQYISYWPFPIPYRQGRAPLDAAAASYCGVADDAPKPAEEEAGQQGIILVRIWSTIQQNTFEIAVTQTVCLIYRFMKFGNDAECDLKKARPIFEVWARIWSCLVIMHKQFYKYDMQ